MKLYLVKDNRRRTKYFHVSLHKAVDYMRSYHPGKLDFLYLVEKDLAPAVYAILTMISFAAIGVLLAYRG